MSVLSRSILHTVFEMAPLASVIDDTMSSEKQRIRDDLETHSLEFSFQNLDIQIALIACASDLSVFISQNALASS